MTSPTITACQKNRPGVPLCHVLAVASLLTVQIAAAQEGRSAKVLAQHTLAPLSLTYFGQTEAELAAAEQRTQYAVEIVRDVGLLALAALVVWRPERRFTVDGWLHGTDTETGNLR